MYMNGLLPSPRIFFRHSFEHVQIFFFGVNVNTFSLRDKYKIILKLFLVSSFFLPFVKKKPTNICTAQCNNPNEYF